MQQAPSSDRETDAPTQLILEAFRLNGGLITAGDRLVADLGLTSARWQVLGVIALSPTVEPVARSMGPAPPGRAALRQRTRGRRHRRPTTTPTTAALNWCG
ncbi:hypothetical protein [Bradyrhizobium sp. Arg237L]|uniref:hypothetical protein n=1 Tax=Bradyrhizobium sp. Arg237L TaxID=3003352 RepID=UPI0032B74B9F